MRCRHWCLGVALLVSPAGVAGASTDSTDALVVETEAGAVRGVATSRTLEWRGIPYVAAPVGELRWQPPRLAPPWSGIREAREFGPHCPQLGPDGVDGEEDCIYLNVFTPTARGSQPLPVMVHLHGGSNSGFWAYRNAAALVEHDVIVVTIEYRLGVLGFVGHPELSAEGGGHSGEYGVLDQIAALEWVHDNIAAFGGDPDNVTLFGESAGSFDAAALIVSPLSRDLVHRAALQTESFWALHDVDSIAEAEDIGRDVAGAVGCSQASDPAGCLRLTPVEDLVEAAGPLDVAPWSGGAVLPAAPIELMEEHPVTIPLLIGSNREEAAFFFAEVFEDTPYPSDSYQRDTDEIAGAAVGDAVRALYPADAYDSELWAAIAAFTDAIYTCPMRRVGLAADGPVWRYLYTHRLDGDPFLASLRASHFLDEPILWADTQLLDGFDAADYEFTAGDAALSTAMATYWTNFARTGDPNGTDVPQWPAFDASGERVLELADPIVTIDHWRTESCALFDTITEPFPES
jgi:para-nitrobenzyl esterase